MGRRRASWVIAAAVVASGCIPRTYNTMPSGGSAAGAAGGTATVSRPAPRPLTPAEQRVQQLEAQLAERDREIAAVQNEIQSARQQPAPAVAAAPAPPPAARGEAASEAPAEAAGAAGAASPPTTQGCWRPARTPCWKPAAMRWDCPKGKWAIPKSGT